MHDCFAGTPALVAARASHSTAIAAGAATAFPTVFHAAEALTSLRQPQLVHSSVKKSFKKVLQGLGAEHFMRTNHLTAFVHVNLKLATDSESDMND